MSKAPPPPPPVPHRLPSAMSGLPVAQRTSTKTLQEELESRIPRTEDIFIDSATYLYSTKTNNDESGALCRICNNRVTNQQAHSNSHATQIFPWLFLGSMNNSQDASELGYIGIDTIINCTSECSNFFLTRYKYFNFPLVDSYDNKGIIKEIAFLLENLRLDGHRVFIHCFQGVSRGPSTVIYYLMKFTGMPLREAFSFLRNRKTTVKPSRNMLQQLIEMEEELFGTITMLVIELWESEDD